MTYTGSCACGAITFEVTKPFLGAGSCHCTDCQKMSGGGPNYVALTPRDGLKILSGEPKVFKSLGGSGAEVGRAFCGDCGTPLWSIPAHEPFIPIKMGAFDDIGDLEPQMQIFVEFAPSWHRIDPDKPAFAKAPPMPG